MQSECLSIEVLPDASHLHCIFCVTRPSIGIRWSQETHGIVSFLEHKHPDNLLITIQDKISSKLVPVFS